MKILYFGRALITTFLLRRIILTKLQHVARTCFTHTLPALPTMRPSQLFVRGKLVKLQETELAII